jgi:membrane fusion protein, multidrug efflux system
MTAPLDPSLPPPPQRRRKRTVALMIFLCIVAVAAVGGLLYWNHARQFEETDDAFVDGNIAPVAPQIAGRVSAVRVSDNRDVKAGDLLVEIDPTDYVNNVNQAKAGLESAQTRLEAAKTNVELVKATTEAAIVQAKAALTTSQAAVVQAQAGVERAQAGIQQAQATVHGAEAQMASAQADVNAAQSEATRREADVKRYEAVDPRATSQQQRDIARAAFDSATAQLSAAQKRKMAADALVEQEKSKVTANTAALAEARSAVAQAESRVGQAQGALLTAQTAPQQVANAQAQVKTAEAGVDQARVALANAAQQLTYTRIVAPISGRVTRKSVQPGQFLDPGRTLMVIVDPNVWVTANFKETQLTHMKAGQYVDIYVDMYPGRVFKAQIDSFQSGTGARFSLMPPENATGNYVKVVQRVPVKIVFTDDPAAQQLLGPGMSVVPRVHVGGNEGTPSPIASTTQGANP